MCSDVVFLTTQGFPHVNVTVLKDGHGVPEYEVLGAVYVTVAVELALRKHVQGVLVPFEATSVEDGKVRGREECNGLVVFWSGCVFKGYVPSDEFASRNCCDIIEKENFTREINSNMQNL